VETLINILFDLKVILAKNLVGKQFTKGFFESTEPSDFENFKEGDKKFLFKF
jgi:isoleucyl-tRNA synthetase